MNTIVKKLQRFWKDHTVISSVIVLAVLFGGYEIYAKTHSTSSEPRYVLGTVTKGTITSSITGSGQVSASNQIDLKAKASGDIVAIHGKVGDEIKAGATIVQIDSVDAALDLENARNAYNDLITVDPLDVLKAKNAVDDAQSALTTEYNKARATLTASSFDMANVQNGLNTLIFSKDGYLRETNNNLEETEKTYQNKANQSYYIAQNALEAFQKSTVGISGETDLAILETKINGGYDAALIVAKAAKDAKDAVAYISRDAESTDTQASTANTTVSDLTATINGTTADLLSAKESIANDKRKLAEAQISYQNVKDGPTATAIKSQELTVRSKEQAYADHFIQAPFDGVLGRLDVNQNDSLSSGATVGVFLSKTKIADVSLNEVDVAHVKAGEKVVLTFDAVDGLTISGEVAEVDLVGTVTQGVVNYNVKIAFDTEDDRVKSGMSVSAAIITDVKQDVLTVPNSAIKSQGGANYVQMFSPALQGNGGSQGVASTLLPSQVPVEIGVSNDTSTEIISGLKEGDQIVTRTIAATTAAAATQAPSLFGAAGARTGGGARAGGATGR